MYNIMEIETYKWDYTFEYEMKLDKLKELGKQGWEVCGGDTSASGTRFLLKRPCGKVRIVTRDQVQNNGYENER